MSQTTAPDPRVQAQELLDLWERLGRAHATVGNSCSCGTHGIVVTLADFEQDIADYLLGEAQQHGQTEALAFLETNARAGAQWSIRRLLSSMAHTGATLDAAIAGFLLERLDRTMRSFETLHGAS